MAEQRDTVDGSRDSGAIRALTRQHQLHFSRSFTDWSWKTRLVGYAVLVFALVIAPGALFVVLAKAERGVQDQYNRTIGLRKIYNNVVRTAAVTDIRICACQPDRVEHVVLQDGFETALFIYEPGGSKPRPAIVLVHGNVWMGQRLSAYRVVADALRRNGYIVLSFDKVGFGKSDDPFGRGPDAVAAAYDYTGQVNNAVEYLIKHTNADPNNITLLGHSGGVTQALELGQQSDRIANVVAWIAPFAPDSESEIEANQQYLNNKFHATYELIYGRNIPDWFEWHLTGIEWQDPDIIWRYFRQQDHKPLIVVLGEYDQPDAHPAVYEHFDTLTEPKELVHVSRSDHYLNTAQSLRWVFYDRKMVDELVNKLTTYLNGD